jgi:hypothetical protein
MRVRKRLRRIKRLAYLGALVGVVFALRQAKAKRDARNVLGAPASWPPLEIGEQPIAAVGDLFAAAEPASPASPAVAPEPVVSDEPTAAVGDIAGDGALAWVEPDGGSCPLSHPIKANGNSRIYHEPGGQFYERTKAERCYIDAAAAEADGYRAAKGA